MKVFYSYRRVFLLLLTLCVSTNIQAYNAKELFTTQLPTHSGYVKVKDGKLYYQSYGKGPLIILLHGGPGLDHTYLLPGMLALAKNHQVVFYDQRGSGKSFVKEITNKRFTIPQFVSDLEAIRKHLGAKKFILMGHSWGGFLAMNYAIRHSNHVSSVVLINPAPATSMGFKNFLEEYNKKTLPIKAELDAIQASEDFKNGKPTTIAEFYRRLYSVYFHNPRQADTLSFHFTKSSALNSFKIFNIFVETYFSKEYDLRKNLKKLNLPTLVLTGGDDILPLWTVRETATSIPNARMVVLEQCGHFPYIEKPNQLFKEINDFLKSVLIQNSNK